jgi:hypothetical protein
VDKCLEAVRASGRDPDAYEVAGGVLWLLIAREPERRWKEALPHFLYQLNLYARWFSEAGMPLFPAASSREELERTGFLILRPEQGGRADPRVRRGESRDPLLWLDGTSRAAAGME